MYRGNSTQYLNYVGKEDDEPTPPTMTRSSGEPIPNYRNSVTVGPRGCPLMSDHILLEDLQHVNRGRIPERVFHASGVAAHGYFEVTNDITRYCAAKLFDEVGKRTPVFTRFSLASGGKGIAETLFRGLRGMACKFYTEEGNWDLTCNSAQVFVANDPILVVGIQQTSTPDEANLSDPNRVWDHLSLLPESTFFQLWFQSDFGLPYTYRFMNTFAVNTYKMINKHGEPIFVRFTFITNQGLRYMPSTQAAQIAGANPDFFTQDMVEAIARGDYPSWVLNIQVMSAEVAKDLDFNPFNVTKVWPVEQFPLIEVGRLTLNRNMTNHFDEAEQAVFNPGNFVPGIRAAEGDKNLTGRMFIYQDTQIYRMGVNHNQIPINRPLNPVANYQREGRGVFVSQGAAPHYFPNSFGGPVESAGAAELEPSAYACGDVMRVDDREEDHFVQARYFYNSLTMDQKQRMIATFGTSLRPVMKRIQERVLGLLERVDRELQERVEEAIAQQPDDDNKEAFTVVN